MKTYIIAGLALLLPHVALADDPCIDRPGRTTAPCVVPMGAFQIEADAFNWQQAGATLVANSTFKYGVGHGIDLELNMAPVERVGTKTGIGDAYLKTKIVAYKSDQFAAGLLPYVKIPTAQPGIGNTHVEGGVVGAFQYSLPLGFTLQFSPEIDLYHNVYGSGYFTSFQQATAISHDVGPVTLYTEIWTQGNQRTVDLAISWMVRPTVQLDMGVYVGASRVTPAAQVYTGITKIF